MLDFLKIKQGFRNYLLSLGRDYVITTISAIFIAANIQTIVSKDYWIFVQTKTIDVFLYVLSFFEHSLSYSFTHLTLLSVILLLIRGLNNNSWIDDVKYKRIEQLNFYVTELLDQGNNINTKEDLDSFIQDIVDSLHKLFINKSTDNSATWLLPKGKNLTLFRYSKGSKYDQDTVHFEFKAKEGVVGNSWFSGDIELYSKKQENKYYKNREQCGDRSYICCPIIQKSMNQYGILAIGSDKNIYWHDEDKEVLRLISTVLSKTLNDLDEDLKAKCNLPTL